VTTAAAPASGPEAGDPARPVAVIDIDGVVADVRHRLALIEGTPPRWEDFFLAAEADPPLPEGVALVLALRHDHDVVWLTGRPERTRPLTEQWLTRIGLPSAPLLMRRDSDRRPARHAKVDALRDLSTRRRIALVVDDDPAVVRELRNEGYTVKLAEWLPHSSTLRRAQQREGRT